MENPINIPHKNDHILLNELYNCKPSTDEKTIQRIVNNKLGYFNYLSPTHERIYKSAQKLMKDVINVESLPDATKKIAGAINGLNILLKHETKKETQAVIKGEIEEATKMEKKIKNILQIKEAIASLSKKNHPLQNNEELFNDFGIFRNLFGRTRTLNSSFIKSYILFWSNPTGKKLLNNFISAAKEAREKNLKLIENDKLPKFEKEAISERKANFEAKESKEILKFDDTVDEYNDRLRDAHNELNEFSAGFQNTKSDHELFMEPMDIIFNTRCILTNAQINTDGYYLAFNSEHSGALSKRLRVTENTINRDKEAIKELLNPELESDKTSSADKKINEKKLALLEDGYIPKGKNFYYYLVKWEPIIGPNDPIQPLKRTIGFALLEGKRNESAYILDLTNILGKDNLNLNLSEKQLLSELLIDCDTCLGLDPSVDTYWKIYTPSRIQKVLEKFNNDQLPHLKNLSTQQKNELINAAFKFSRETTLQMTKDLLTLS